MQDKVDALTTKKREQELRDSRNEEKKNERKQALSHGQIVSDPKKIKKLEAQEIRRKRKL